MAISKLHYIMWNLIALYLMKIWRFKRKIVIIFRKSGNCCERSPQGLSQLKGWSEEQKTPLRDRDHSRNDPYSVSCFVSRASGVLGTVPEQVHTCGLRRNSSNFDKAAKIRDSVRLNCWDSFLVTLPSISSDTWVMYSSVIPGANVFCDKPFLALSCVSLEMAARFRLFFSVAIMRKRKKLNSFEPWIKVFFK